VDKGSFYTFFRQIPKPEIHLHLEAVISRSSVKKLYRRKTGTMLTADAADALFSYTDLSGFIRAFLQVQELFTDTADFDLVFADLAAYLEKNGITYTEVFFAPSAFLKKGFSYAALMENFHRNIRKIETEKNVTIRLLIDVSRTFGPENAQQNLELVLRHRIPEVIGIGLGGDERRGPARDFKEVFANAQQAGLHTVAHAGEDVGPESIWDTITLLRAERIGHGVSAAGDSSLMDYLQKKQIPLEVCPTSNVFTRRFVTTIQDHPVRQFFDHGLCVTLNTDDPLFFKVSLLDEYWNLYRKLHFTPAELIRVIENGYQASFLSGAQRKTYLQAVTAAAGEVG
jgi:adenosine deaminase